MKKKLLFVHSSEILRYKDTFYNTGSFTVKSMKRFTGYFDEVTIGGKITSVDRVLNYTCISNNRLSFFYISWNLKGIYHNIKVLLDHDVVVIRLPDISGLLILLLCLLFNRKVVIEVVGNSFDALRFHSNFGKFIAWPIHIVHKILIYFSKNVTYITFEYLQDIYPTRGVVCDFVPNIIFDDDMYNIDILRNRVDLINNKDSNDTFTIGMIGSYDVLYKGHEDILYIAKELKEKGYNLNIEFVGKGNSSRLKALIDKLGVSDCVSFIGVVPNEELFNWFDRIDFYMQPSRTEAQGRSVVEACSRACPVVCTNIGGMRELITSEYRYDIGDLGKAVEIVIDLIKNKESVILAAQNNFNTAKMFKSSIILDKLWSYYDKIVS